jgi:Protein of unknown function (DUF642)
VTRRLLGVGAAAAAISGTIGGSIAAAAPPPLPTLVRNGSFEHPRVRVGSSHPFRSIPGWRLAFGPDIEIQNHVAGAAALGDQVVELDSDASSGIYQRIPTRPNRLYRVQFFFSPRPGTSAAENVLVVKWHRRVVARLTGDGTGLVSADWHMYAIKVRATGRATRLEFDDGGISDSVGTLIDGVTVTRWRGHPTATR